VLYYSNQDENAPKVPVNFVTGAINGYFDVQKHQPGQWNALLNAAVAEDFDLVGKYALLTFPVSKFIANTPNGKELIDVWDDVVRLEHEFMGLYKYNRVNKNRMYCHGDYEDRLYMYAVSYRTCYNNKSTLGDILQRGQT
jgi:hypothetical protein